MKNVAPQEDEVDAQGVGDKGRVLRRDGGHDPTVRSASREVCNSRDHDQRVKHARPHPRRDRGNHGGRAARLADDLQLRRRRSAGRRQQVRLTLLAPWPLLALCRAAAGGATAERVAERARRQEAISIAPQSDVSKAWYAHAAEMIGVAQTAAPPLRRLAAVPGRERLPSSALEWARTTLSACWQQLLASYTEKQLFIGGIGAAFFASYGVGLAFRRSTWRGLPRSRPSRSRSRCG